MLCPCISLLCRLFKRMKTFINIHQISIFLFCAANTYPKLRFCQLPPTGMGIGIILSSLTTKYRALQVLVSFGVTLWMYATPVVYPLSQIGEGTLRTILLANPVASPVELMRYILTGAGTIDPFFMTISIIFTIAVVIIGIFMFNRVEKTFIDTI